MSVRAALISSAVAWAKETTPSVWLMRVSGPLLSGPGRLWVLRVLRARLEVCGACEAVQC